MSESSSQRKKRLAREHNEKREQERMEREERIARRVEAMKDPAYRREQERNGRMAKQLVLMSAAVLSSEIALIKPQRRHPNTDK